MLIAFRIPVILRLKGGGEEFIDSIQREQRRVVPRYIQILKVFLRMLFIGNFIIRVLKIHVVGLFIRVPAVGHAFANRTQLHTGIRILLDQKRELRIGGTHLDNRHLHLLLSFILRIIISACIFAKNGSSEQGKSITSPENIPNAP
ncbi:hypothetical protein D3C81_1220970 [compost metagenome]